MWATSRDSQLQSLSTLFLNQSTDPRCSKGGERLTQFTRSFILHRCRATIAAADLSLVAFKSAMWTINQAMGHAETPAQIKISGSGTARMICMHIAP